MKKRTQPVGNNQAKQGTLATYTIGFILSVILTLIPFFFVINHTFGGWTLMWVLLAFAVLQLGVQLQFFIHLGHESKPRWSTILFLFTLFVVLVIGIGSLWIMDNLDYHTMTPHETNEYIQDEEGIHR